MKCLTELLFILKTSCCGCHSNNKPSIKAIFYMYCLYYSMLLGELQFFASMLLKESSSFVQLKYPRNLCYRNRTCKSSLSYLSWSCSCRPSLHVAIYSNFNEITAVSKMNNTYIEILNSFNISDFLFICNGQNDELVVPRKILVVLVVCPHVFQVQWVITPVIACTVEG